MSYDPNETPSIPNFERDISDTAKIANQTSGTVTNRAGTTVRPLPVVIAEAESSLLKVYYVFGSDTFTITSRSQLGVTSTGEKYQYIGVMPFNVTLATDPVNNPDFIEVAPDSEKVEQILSKGLLWESTIVYSVNARVQRNNVIYEAKLEQSNNDPASDDGTNWSVTESTNLTFKSISDLKSGILSNGSIVNIKTVPIGSRVDWQGYYEQSDGGSNWGVIKSGSYSDDGGHILGIDSNIYIESNLKGNKINIRKFGARSDSDLSTLNTNNAPKIQNIVDYLSSRGGGHIYTPSPQSDGEIYGIEKPNENTACITVTSNNYTFSGDGPSSIWKTYKNEDVPLHFSSDENITNASPSGLTVSDFEVYGMHIKGTGIYENFGLAKGRGILFRNATNVSVHDNTITSMSMIGICSEGGDGYFRVQNNQIHSCRYTGINYNGRCYQSIISGNIVSKCNAEINSVAIQATGHCIINGNTVIGEVANTANCGGIEWGEGNYDGIGSITNNLVKHTSYGIKAVYHGSCNINGNTVINALNQGGINLVSTTTAGFTVANSDNICSNNLIINCAPYGVDCSANNTIINGNKVRNFTPIINPSSGTEPDGIVGTTTIQGIRVRGEDCSITANMVSGCNHGITTTVDKENGIIGGNTYKDNTYDYSIESAVSGTFSQVGHAIIEREQASPNIFRERIFRTSRPTQGYFNLSSIWNNPSPSIGNPIGELVLFARKGTAAVSSASGSTNIQLVSTSGWFPSSTATVCGIELDNGAWHWTTLNAVSSPNITIGTPIPQGRTVNANANVWYNSWRPLANLA